MYIPELVRKEGLRRRLSPGTIKTYNYCIGRFFRKCKKDPKEISKKDVREFLDDLVKMNRSGSTINVYLQSLIFLFTQILGKRLLINIKFAKTRKRLPTVLSKSEILQLIEVVINPKHKLIIGMLYAAGLRVSELTHLKVEDLDFSTNRGWVRQGKGNKDRIFIIAQGLRQQLIDHIGKNGIEDDGWVFQGHNNYRMSVMSVQKLVKRAAKKAGIKKRVYPHALRHSFASHVMTQGNDLISLQSLLGHKSPETTMVYVHTAHPKMLSVKSPFDSM